MPPAFDIVDDTIVPHGGSYDTITPHESNVRNAMLVITIAAPVIGSFVVWLYSPRPRNNEKRRKLWFLSVWNFDWLVVLWFWSVTIFGTLMFAQRGHTNRLTFMFAILHTQVEVLMNGLLLHLSLKKALTLASLWGLVLFLATLVLPNMTLVFFASSILGGGNDALVALILLYGRKWVYALGAVFHLISAVWVFADSVIFIDIVLYNGIIFISLWLYVAFTTAAIIYNTPAALGGGRNDYIRLTASPVDGPSPTDSPTHLQVPRVSSQFNPDLDEQAEHDQQGSRNPMKDVDVPPCVLLLLIGVGLVGSTAITVTLYVLA